MVWEGYQAMLSLAGKAIHYNLRNPCGFNIWEIQVFCPPASCNWGAGICGQSFYLAKLNKHIRELRNPLHLPKQLPSLHSGWLVNSFTWRPKTNKGIVEKPPTLNLKSYPGSNCMHDSNIKFITFQASLNSIISQHSQTINQNYTLWTSTVTTDLWSLLQ